jgi:hypothetical protein
MTDTIHINEVPLFQLNPNRLLGHPQLLANVLERFNAPWKEHVSLPDSRATIANTFELSQDDPVVDLILENEVLEITSGDMFINGDDTVLVRVFTIANGKAIAASAQERDLSKEGLFTRELEHFDSGEPHRFVADGHIYIDKGYRTKNVTLWDGANFRMINQPENNFEIPYSEFEFEGKSIVGGGYNFSERINYAVTILNELNATRYRGQVNHEWVVGKPHHMLDDTYVFMNEVFNDGFELFAESLGVCVGSFSNLIPTVE